MSLNISNFRNSLENHPSVSISTIIKELS